jgi:hypothetical protein
MLAGLLACIRVGLAKGTLPGSGTPAVSYTLTVTGSSGSGSNALNDSIVLTLTVK